MSRKGCCSDSNELQPSELNRKIDLYEYKTTTDSEGIATKEWTKVRSFWAKRTPLSGEDIYEGAAYNIEKSVKYIVRYRKNTVYSDMRIYDNHDKRTYLVKVPLDDFYGDRTQTHIIAELVENA
jgi:SPP1 family predicted phage head-tail adaptor